MLFAGLPEPVRRLRSLALFASCTVHELRQVDRLATAMNVPRGHILCRRGDVGHECFVIVEGEVDVAFEDHHLVVGAGTIVGEIALLTPRGRRTATIAAKTDTKLLVFTRTEFGRLINTCPSVAHKIVRESARRLIEDIYR